MPMLHYPADDRLQTGDLLFPKVAVSAASPFWLSVRKRFDLPDADEDKLLRDYLVESIGPDVIDVLRNDAFRQDVSALLALPQVRSPSPSAFSSELASVAAALSALRQAPDGTAAGASGLGHELSVLGGELTRLAAQESDRRAKADRTMLMLCILIKAFPDLLDVWLGMPVTEFLAHPLRKLLLGALDGESGPGFFVGHVAMVLRERDGAHAPDGQVWVIEANTTDFAHYRVSLHRYLVEGEPVAKPGGGVMPPARLRGWANRRLVMGESIWHSRHRALLGDETDAAALDFRRRLVDVAKSFLGRPYGFFDDPRFGDDGRFYCGEFVQRVLSDVGGARLQVDQNRSWDWLYTNRKLLGDAAFVKDLELALQTGGLLAKMQGKPFFLLTLPMLYLSGALERLDAPGTPPYVHL